MVPLLQKKQNNSIRPPKEASRLACFFIGGTCGRLVPVMARFYTFEGIENFRDLGGYECAFGETQFGVIYRSATLLGATESDLAKIKRLGVKTILDLRGNSVETTSDGIIENDADFKVLRFEVNGKGRIPKDWQDGIESYMEMLEDASTCRRILQAVLHSEKPLLIHCNAGKDRTGVFVALLLDLAGVDFPSINADFMASFPLLEKSTMRIKAERPDFLPEVCLNPDISYLREVRQCFYKRYGSPEGYCEAIGLNDDEIFSLKNVLGKQEKSCGAVLFHGGKVLVEHMQKGHFSIPKGHVEDCDEGDEMKTAAREVKEELSLDVEFIPGFRVTTDYSPFPGVFKQVVWFAAYVKNTDIVTQKEEVLDAYWLSPADAVRVLSHQDDRDVVTKASYFEAGIGKRG